nr:MAG TPA: hypothetical protein [Caudoviricetes sp.]
MSLKWFVIEKAVNFGYLLKFIFDCLMAYIGQLNFYLLRTSQGRLIMLAAIIIALLVIDRDDEKN